MPARRLPDIAFSREELEAAGREMFGRRWQTDLARAVDIAPSTVRRYLTGDTIPGPVAVAVRLTLREHRRNKGQPWPPS